MVARLTADGMLRLNDHDIETRLIPARWTYISGLILAIRGLWQATVPCKNSLLLMTSPWTVGLRFQDVWTNGRGMQ